jgi:uncharacterized protein (TIGR00297 family)
MSDALIYLIIIVASVIGYLVRSLTVSGAVTASLVGILIGFGLGVQGLVLLGIFFATSSLWSKYKKKEKKKMEDITEKGERRDYVQVLANGFFPAFFSFLYLFFPSEYWLLAFCIAIAAANADTWASEIGSLSKRPPTYILTFQTVKTGTSGAVSPLGMIASFLGALLISFVALILFDEITYISLLIITASGLLGSLIDTVIGATIQAKYRCINCQLSTEKLMHCRQPTHLISGKGWINNDLTNFLSILVATSIGIVLYFLAPFNG